MPLKNQASYVVVALRYVTLISDLLGRISKIFHMQIDMCCYVLPDQFCLNQLMHSCA